MSAKIPKVRQRGPDGRPTGVTLRPLRIAVDDKGVLVEIDNDTSRSTLKPRTLPEGWRWATADEADAYHARRVAGETGDVQWRTTSAPEVRVIDTGETNEWGQRIVRRVPRPPQPSVRGEQRDEDGRRIPATGEERARRREPGKRGTSW